MTIHLLAAKVDKFDSIRLQRPGSVILRALPANLDEIHLQNVLPLELRIGTSLGVRGSLWNQAVT